MSTAGKRTRRVRTGKGRFRSIFERKLADTLRSKGVKYDYEREKFVWYSEGRNAVLCPNCGEIRGLVRRQYTPDFFIRETGVVIEAKGRLTRQDRQKLIDITERHPNLDLRILFQTDAVFSTSAGTRNKRGLTNTQWAAEHGITSAVAGREGKHIPDGWLFKTKEKKNG
jgi:hypothetical protein